MNYRYAVAAAVAVSIIGITALAQKQAQSQMVYLLKSGGKVVAELHLRSSAALALHPSNPAGSASYDMATGKLAGTGGVVLTLMTGTNSISVKADEIDSVPAPE